MCFIQPCSLQLTDAVVCPRCAAYLDKLSLDVLLCQDVHVLVDDLSNVAVVSVASLPDQSEN